MRPLIELRPLMELRPFNELSPLMELSPLRELSPLIELRPLMELRLGASDSRPASPSGITHPQAKRGNESKAKVIECREGTGKRLIGGLSLGPPQCSYSVRLLGNLYYVFTWYLSTYW